MKNEFDLVLKNVEIVDGTGEKPFKGSIGIIDDKITEVGNIKGKSKNERDCSGFIACPGFIDIHAHADVNILQYPSADNFIMQGITSTVGGNCGMSIAPINEYVPWGVFTSSVVGSWWHEVEPYSCGPPSLISLEKYGKILEKKLGFKFDYKDFDEFLKKLDTIGISLNYVPLIGHNSVRLAVMGEDFRRKAKKDEIEKMKRYVENAMKSGAFGLGAGFDGGPGDFAAIEEVVQLAEIVKKYNGIYASHTRNFDNNYPSNDPEEWGYGICHNIPVENMPAAKYYGLMESIEIAKKTGVSVQIAHLAPVYTIYQYYPEVLQEATAKATIQIIDQARADGLNITFDIIPDDDLHGVMLSKPSLIGLFSLWITKCGSKKQLVENLKISQFRAELKKEIMNGKFKFIMIHPKTDCFWMNRIIIMKCKKHNYQGKTLNIISELMKRDPFEMLFDIIIEDPDTLFSCVDPRWTEATVREFIKYPDSMIGSDLNIVPFGESDLQGGGGLGVGEPGLATYAIYPRFIRRYVKEKSILTIEKAIEKATSLPAKKLGLKNRGVIKSGNYADILIFDLDTIGDRGTWENPKIKPDGIKIVIVNGKIAYENMNFTGIKSGKVLRHM